MAEEEKSEDQGQTEEQAPEAEAPAEQAPGEEEAPAEESEDAPAEEAEEAPAEEAPVDEAPPESTEDSVDGGDPAASGREAEEVGGSDDEGLDWKARGRLERSRRPADARPQRSPEERQGEREQRRGAKAVERRRHRERRRTKKGEPLPGTPPAERRPNPAKVRQGIVVSDRADKTITVRIDIARRHPTYEKIVRRSRTLHAHDESNEAGQGDVVRVVETRPISRSKRWRLLEVVERAK
jgi:small subunit ribosomal protein S17